MGKFLAFEEARLGELREALIARNLIPARAMAKAWPAERTGPRV